MYYFSKNGREFRKACEIVHKFSMDVIRKRRRELKEVMKYVQQLVMSVFLYVRKVVCECATETHPKPNQHTHILDPSLPTRQWTCQELSPSLLQKSDSDLTASKGRRKYLDFIDTLLEAKVPLCVCVCVCVH